MIDFIIKLAQYRWVIKVVFIVDDKILTRLAEELKYQHFDREMIVEMYDTLYKHLDTGFVCTDPDKHLSYMIVNNATTVAEFIDTLNHEKNHIEMHICEYYGIDPYSEEASYLSGHLAKSIYLGIIDNLNNN